MKRITSTLLTIMFLISFFGSSLAEEQKSYEEIFEKDKVIDIKIDILEEDLKSIYDNPLLEEYHTANITIDGVFVENIGIRTKGNSSLNSVARSDNNRYSYRIKFNKYIKGQKLLGLDEMVINNMFSDASYMREYLSYEAMCEAGMAAPLSAFANIYINGEPMGTYLAVEAIEDAFLDRTFGNSKGNLYKQEQGSTLIYSENSEYLSSELKTGKDTEKTGLKNMIKVLNEKGDYESVLDVESCLKLIAANAVLGSYDSYNGQFAHNYYMYDQDGIVSAIPWDYNMSFGGFGQGGSGWSTSVDTPVSGVSMEQRPLINNLLEVPEYKAKYLEYVSGFADYLKRMPERAAELADIIRPYVENDPTKFVSMESFENSIIYVEEQERSMQQGGNRGMGGMGNMPNMQNMEAMQAAMAIIQAAGANELSETDINKLHDLGFTDEQIAMFKNMPQGGIPGGMDGGQRQGGMGGGMPPQGNNPENGETNTRGNMGGMGGGQRQGGMGGMPPQGNTPENGGQNSRGNMGGGLMIRVNGIEQELMNKVLEIIDPMNISEITDEQIAALREIGLTDEQIELLKNMPQAGDRGNIVIAGIGGGMGGGSIITYSVKRFESIYTQLNGDKVPEIKVMLSGNEVKFDVAPIIENDRTLVPLRAIFEALNMTVTYDNGYITAEKEGIIINLTVGSTTAHVNNQEKILDVPGKIINDRTLVPLRFIGEATGLTVTYDNQTRVITME